MRRFLVVAALAAGLAAPMIAPGPAGARPGPLGGGAPVEVRQEACGNYNVYVFGQPLFLHPMVQCPQPMPPD